MVWATHGGSSGGCRPDSSSGGVGGGATRHLFGEMPNHQQAATGGVLRITVSHVLYPVTKEVLHQVLEVYGVEKMTVFERSNHVEATVQLRSWQEAKRARDAFHGRCIYEGCCFLDILLEQPTPDSASSTTARRDAEASAIAPEVIVTDARTSPLDTHPAGADEPMSEPVSSSSPGWDWEAMSDEQKDRCLRMVTELNETLRNWLGRSTPSVAAAATPSADATPTAKMPARCLTVCHYDDIFLTGTTVNAPSVMVLQRDTIPDGTRVLTSTPSGAAVHSIDLGDEHVPKLSCCQLGVRKLFDEMLIRSTVVLWPPPMNWDERQPWPPPSRVVIKCSGVELGLMSRLSCKNYRGGVKWMRPWSPPVPGRMLILEKGFGPTTNSTEVMCSILPFDHVRMVSEEYRMCGEVPKKALVGQLAILNKPEVSVLLFGSLAAGVHGVLFPMFGIMISNAIKTFYEPAEKLRKDSSFWGLMCVVLGIVSIISIPAEYFLFGIAGGKLIERIRTMSFQSIVHREVAWFDDPKNSSGTLGARLSIDALNVQRLVGDSLALAVQITSTLITGFVIAMIVDWKLSLIILCVIPLVGLQGYAQVKFLKGFSQDAKMMYEEASQVATDAISSIRTIASFCSEKRVTRIYDHKCEASKHQGVRTGMVGGLGFGFSFLMLYLTYGLCFYVGAQFVRHGTSNFGDVFKVFFALVLATIGISQTSALASDSTKAKDSAISIFAERGLRSLAVAYPEVLDGRKESPGGPWHFVGLMPLSDPPRHDSAETIRRALILGVNVKMITSDQLTTRKETGRRLGMGTHMYPSSALLGQNKDESSAALPVDDLIKKADIGIAIAEATDAARSASDIVLTEPGHSVVISAVLTSRAIFQRMKNYTIHAVSITIRIVLGFMLLALIWAFDFPPFMVLIIAILNDGTIMTISKDQVEPSPLPTVGC